MLKIKRSAKEFEYTYLKFLGVEDVLYGCVCADSIQIYLSNCDETVTHDLKENTLHYEELISGGKTEAQFEKNLS